MLLYYQNQVWLPTVYKIQQKQSYFDYISPSCDLDTNILNLYCDSNFERNNPVLPQDTLAYEVVLPNQVWLQMDQQFRRYSKKQSYFDYISPCCDLDIEKSNQFFLFDTLPHDNTPQYQVWLKTVEWFRRYRADTIGQTDRTTDGRSEPNIPPTPVFIREGIITTERSLNWPSLKVKLNQQTCSNGNLRTDAHVTPYL